MVWEQQVQVIVMTTRTFERGRQKCGQYWPSELSGGEPLVAGPFIVSLKNPQAAAAGAAATGATLGAGGGHIISPCGPEKALFFYLFIITLRLLMSSLNIFFYLIFVSSI